MATRGAVVLFRIRSPLTYLLAAFLARSEPTSARTMPAHHGPDPLEIALESSDLVLRGFTGDEFDPAVLNGEVILNLTHPTDLREVSSVTSSLARWANPSWF